MDRYTFRNAYYNPKFDLISQTSQLTGVEMAFVKHIISKIKNLFKFKTYHPEKHYLRGEDPLDQ